MDWKKKGTIHHADEASQQWVREHVHFLLYIPHHPVWRSEVFVFNPAENYLDSEGKACKTQQSPPNASPHGSGQEGFSFENTES